MFRLHLCPFHGWENCFFSDDARGHGCTLGVPAVGYWPTKTLDWAVVRRSMS
jgi:hypothetical protein